MKKKKKKRKNESGEVGIIIFVFILYYNNLICGLIHLFTFESPMFRLTLQTSSGTTQPLN